MESIARKPVEGLTAVLNNIEPMDNAYQKGLARKGGGAPALTPSLKIFRWLMSEAMRLHIIQGSHCKPPRAPT